MEKLGLEYHNTEHVANVIRRALQVVNTIQDSVPGLVEINDKNITVFAAAFHDVVQNSKIVDGKRIRSPQNEELSSQRALSVALKTGIFSKSDEYKIKEAIMATFVNFDSSKKTVFQPNIGLGSSIPALAVALADINAAGFDGPRIYKKEGDLLFKENYPGGGVSYRDWLEVQLNFAIGRKELFQKELDFFPPRARTAVAKLFTKFDESIKDTENRLRSFNQ